MPVYSGYTTIVFAKTSDTLSWVGFDVLDASGKQESVTTVSAPYADIEGGNSVTNGWRKVEGGYVCYLSFESAGTKTFRLKENGTVIATLKVNVADGDKAESDWMDAVLASVTTSAMDPFQKMQAVCSYLLKHFRYSVVMDGSYVTLAQYAVPYWVSYRWNSYTSPAVLCAFAQKIGGFSDIHNCYGDYKVGTTDWQITHYYCKVTRNGETRYYEACPSSDTGEISSYSTIDFTKLSSVQHFNSDALVGLNKVAALNDDFEVLSADDGVTYDEVTFDAVTDGVQDESSQAAQGGGATFDATQPDAGESAGTDAATGGVTATADAGVTAGEDDSTGAGTAAGDNASAGFDAVTGDDAADGSATADAGTSAGDTEVSDGPDADAADAAQSTPAPDAAQDAAPGVLPGATFDATGADAGEALPLAA